MAIQVRSIGANQSAVSISLSASVGPSPAKLTVTRLRGKTTPDFRSATNISSSSGIPFSGQLVAYSNRYEQGKNLSISQYIDNSIFLDQNCIVLFRRGLGSKVFTVSKAVRVPYVNVTYRDGRASFIFSERPVVITVQRQGGTSAGGLGDEEWTSNPCESSNVTYWASQALGIIGAPSPGGAGSLRCSYEGSYRSVLSSIYSDLGVSYWWDWRGGGIKIIKPGSSSAPSASSGCGIISSESGKTREGVVTQSSWTFSRWPSLRIREGTASVTSNSYFEVSPIKHPNYPTVDQILEDACPALKTYNALIAKDYISLGFKIVGRIFVNQVLSQDDKEYLKTKYNFDRDKDFETSLKEYLNISGEGEFFLAIQLNSEPAKKEYTAEFFYPYEDNNNDYVSGGSFSFNKIDVSYNPAPTQRGKNKYASTFEDQNGIVRRGYWRGVQPYVTGDTDADDFSLAVEDCIKTVPHDVICDIVDDLSLPGIGETVPPISVTSYSDDPGNQTSSEGNSYLSEGEKLRDQIQNKGKTIIFVKSPRFPITFAGGSTSENPMDLQEKYDYVDPNSIPESPPLPDKPEIQNPCNNLVPNLSNPNLNIVINDGIINGPDLQPGLESANGQTYTISCNGKNINVVMPSESRYKIIRSVKADYFRALADGTINATNTLQFAGGISNTKGLSHQVVVTDITPSEDEYGTVFSVPSSLTSPPSWLSTSQAECDGFFLPIVPGLESLSATLDSRGLRVSYSYKEIPAAVKSNRVISSISRSNSSVILS